MVQNLVFEFLSDDLEDLIRRFKRKRERVGIAYKVYVLEGRNDNKGELIWGVLVKR